MFLFGIAYRSETRFLVFMPNFLRIRSIRFLTRVTDVFFVLHRSIYDEYIGLLRRIHRFRPIVTEEYIANVSSVLRLPMDSSLTDGFFVNNDSYRWISYFVSVSKFQFFLYSVYDYRNDVFFSQISFRFVIRRPR